MRLLATVSVASLLAFTGLPFNNSLLPSPANSSAQAQEVVETNIFGESNSAEIDKQLLLESDDLTFDSDRSLIIATGNVQIAYGETTLVADKIEYNQQSGRVIAYGNVEIVEANGNRIFANEIDVTDDFEEGFVSALNVQTPDNTRIAAESAERRDGRITSFNNGVYTACAQCKDNPSKPPFWSIRAKKVVINNDTRTIEYEDPTFEFFGKPVFRLKHFSHADPAIKRKSGFLIPAFSGAENLGTGYKQGYFFNLAPNYDLTLWGTYYSNQGFLGEAEWRHRLANGEYRIRYAGIDQQSPGTFNANELDSRETDRHAVISDGLFDINERWKFGWNILYQSDENFAQTYSIDAKTSSNIVNDVYLTGLGEKNYFDLRAQDFIVQSSAIDVLGGASFPGNQTQTDQQAFVLPLLDYNAVSGEEFENGQISFDVNLTSIERNAPQISNFDNVIGAPAANERFTGIEGNTTRASAFLEWKGSTISNNGVISTAALNVQGDAIWTDYDRLNTVGNPLLTNESIYRTMPAASFEIRYPLIAQSGTTSHIFEPIAQLIVRPDETDIGQFANEDAQSMVFDTSNLFKQSKFSGYDRVEGGTRANVGFRYSASFVDGASLNVIAGQSFHLAGENSYAALNDLTNAGEESGLETDRSDYVASAQYDSGQGFSLGTAVRLDERDLGLNRAEVAATVTSPDFSGTAAYIFTEEQPNYRFPRDRHELSGSASVKLDENWRLYGSASYDLIESDITKSSVGIAYDNDCFSFSFGYSNLNDDFFGNTNEHTLSFSLGLRTVGGFERSFAYGSEEEN
jgi:LPS-assembly protein